MLSFRDNKILQKCAVTWNKIQFKYTEKLEIGLNNVKLGKQIEEC